MRIGLSAASCQNLRNKRIETFNEAIQEIKKYAVRGTPDDWKRCLVCGILWLPNGIAINTHQLRLILFKCKSSINGSLLQMGYDITCGRSESANTISSEFSILKEMPTEIRQWTVRKKSQEQCFQDHISQSNLQIKNENAENNSYQSSVNSPPNPLIVSIKDQNKSPFPIPDIQINPKIDYNFQNTYEAMQIPQNSLYGSVDTIDCGYDYDFTTW